MIRQVRYVQPYIPTNTQTPYEGGELEALTSSTPFYRGQGVPIQSYRPVVRDGFGAPTMGLKLGDRSKSVEDLQKIVNVRVDGIFGPETQQGLMTWQSANGLTPTGIVDAATLVKMQGGSLQQASAAQPSKLENAAGMASNLWNIFSDSKGKASATTGLQPATTNIYIPESKGMSTGAMIGIAAAGVVVIGLVIMLANRD